MRYIKRMKMDYWHLAHRLPRRPEVWQLRYRTIRDDMATARIELRGLRLLVRVERGANVAELSTRDPDAIADLMDPHPEAITTPFRRVR